MIMIKKKEQIISIEKVNNSQKNNINRIKNNSNKHINRIFHNNNNSLNNNNHRFLYFNKTLLHFNFNLIQKTTINSFINK